MAVIAFLPQPDAELAAKVEAFSIERSYPIDHQVKDVEEAVCLLRKGDVLLMHSLLDLDSDGMKGMNLATDLTDKHGVTIVTVRENYVLKDDSMSHMLVGICFFAQMMTDSYDGDKK